VRAFLLGLTFVIILHLNYSGRVYFDILSAFHAMLEDVINKSIFINLQVVHACFFYFSMMHINSFIRGLTQFHPFVHVHSRFS